MKNILIIGAKGYIGSRLTQDLDYPITSLDLELFSTTNLLNYKIDYNKIDSNFLKQFSDVILLAGHSSVRMCDSFPETVFNNNVRNFISLVSKMNESQTLIYASSGSVYGDCSIESVREEYNFGKPYNMYDFTKQTIDSYITLINPKPKFFGLRFGTVNGYSPVLRDDVMINAMVSSFWKNNKVLLFNESTKRSILGIKDLVNAIKSIINSKNAKSGIYNLASFTLTSGEIARNVSKHLNCKLELVDPKEYNKNSINEKLISSKYNFSLCCQKFEKEFNFVFSESCDTILEDLLKYKNKMILTNRNTPFNYEG